MLTQYRIGQLSVPTRKAIRYSIDSNGTELEQVVHTHRTSCRSRWPRGFGELNPSSHFQIFTSDSMDSSPRITYLLLLRSE